jgi:hypothetical protein
VPAQTVSHVIVSQALACRYQLLPLISRKIGSLLQFAYHDIGQLLCSFYSGCVPVEIMTETRALMFGQKVLQDRELPRRTFCLTRIQVMVMGELSRNFQGEYFIGPPSAPSLASLSGT